MSINQKSFLITFLLIWLAAAIFFGGYLVGQNSIPQCSEREKPSFLWINALLN